MILKLEMKKAVQVVPVLLKQSEHKVEKFWTGSGVPRSGSVPCGGGVPHSGGVPCGCGVPRDRGHGHGAHRERGGNHMPPQQILTWDKIIDSNEQQLEDFPFIESEGLKVRLPNNPNCLDFVEISLTDQVVNLMVEETI